MKDRALIFILIFLLFSAVSCRPEPEEEYVPPIEKLDHVSIVITDVPNEFLYKTATVSDPKGRDLRCEWRITGKGVNAEVKDHSSIYINMVQMEWGEAYVLTVRCWDINNELVAQESEIIGRTEQFALKYNLERYDRGKIYSVGAMLDIGRPIPRTARMEWTVTDLDIPEREVEYSPDPFKPNFIEIVPGETERFSVDCVIEIDGERNVLPEPLMIDVETSGIAGRDLFVSWQGAYDQGREPSKNNGVFSYFDDGIDDSVLSEQYFYRWYTRVANGPLQYSNTSNGVTAYLGIIPEERIAYDKTTERETADPGHSVSHSEAVEVICEVYEKRPAKGHENFFWEKDGLIRTVSKTVTCIPYMDVAIVTGDADDITFGVPFPDPSYSYRVERYNPKKDSDRWEAVTVDEPKAPRRMHVGFPDLGEGEEVILRVAAYEKDENGLASVELMDSMLSHEFIYVSENGKLRPKSRN